MTREPGRIFISYAHSDRKWLEELSEMLAPLGDTSNIFLWDDSQIDPGRIWKESIEGELERASVAVLLVSPSFLASRFIKNNELPPLLKAARFEGLPILWVPIRPCMYSESPLVDFQSAWNPARPLSTLKAANRGNALLTIAEKVKVAANSNTSTLSSTETTVPSSAILLSRADGDVSVYHNWYKIPWNDVLSKAVIVECVVSYMDTWINNAADALEGLLTRGGTLRFYLPKPGSSAAERVIERFPDYQEDAIEDKIKRTETKLQSLRTTDAGTVEVGWTEVFDMYCLMRIDNSVLLVSPYDHFRNNRIQNPTFVVDLVRFPEIASWAEKEFAGFQLDAKITLSQSDNEAD